MVLQSKLFILGGGKMDITIDITKTTIETDRVILRA